MSQTAFAELFNLKRAAIGAYEEERAEPKVEIFVKIAHHFGVPVEDLICCNLQEKQYNPSPTHQGIPMVSRQHIQQFASSVTEGVEFRNYQNISIPMINGGNGLIAFEYADSILITRPIEESLGATPASPGKTLLLLTDGLALQAATSLQSSIRQYEIIYIIKRYHNQDYTETMLSAIAKKLEKL